MRIRPVFICAVFVAAMVTAGCGESPARQAVTCQIQNAQRPVSGPQAKWNGPLGTNTTLSALGGAAWRTGDAYPVTLLGNASGACLVGGSIIGPWPATDPWTLWHYRSALRFSQPNFTVFGVDIENTGDGIKPKDGSGGYPDGFTIFANRVAEARDDCVENDYVHSGTIADNLLDGCYVMFSARPSSAGLDGTLNTMIITGNIGSLEPMTSVYQGASPGHGGFFKWSAQAPSVILTGNTLLARQVPNHGNLEPPTRLLECSANVIVWLGIGPFPADTAWRSRCPDTIITTNPAVYETARAAWLAMHHPGA